MQKLICLLVLSFLVFGCVTENKVMLDSRKNIKKFYPELGTNCTYYDKNYDVFSWYLVYYSPIEKKEVAFTGFFQHPNAENRKALESGNYKIMLEVDVDLYQKSILDYPIWMQTNKNNGLKIVPIDIDQIMKEADNNIKGSGYWYDLKNGYRTLVKF